MQILCISGMGGISELIEDGKTYFTRNISMSLSGNLKSIELTASKVPVVVVPPWVPAPWAKPSSMLRDGRVAH